MNKQIQTIIPEKSLLENLYKNLGNLQAVANHLKLDRNKIVRWFKKLNIEYLHTNRRDFF